LADRGIEAVVKGGASALIRSGRKMERKSVGFEQLSDISVPRGVKTPTIVIRRSASSTRRWPVVPGRFKDYISTRSRTTTFDPHHGDRAEQAARRAADRTTIDARDREYGTRRIRSTKTAPDRRPNCVAGSTATHGCGGPLSCWPRGSKPGRILEHTQLELFHTKCSASHQGQN